MAAGKDRMVGIQALRVIACVLVIAIHTIGYYVYVDGGINYSLWL